MAKANQNLMRSLLGLILTSDLTDLELRGLVRDLRSREFTFELADFIETLLFTTSRNESISKPEKSFQPDLERAMSAVRQRRLTKTALLNLIHLYLPPSAQARVPNTGNTYELLQRFFDLAPREATERFLQALDDISKNEDPFLKGIQDR